MTASTLHPTSIDKPNLLYAELSTDATQKVLLRGTASGELLTSQGGAGNVAVPATPLGSSSGNVANAAAVATLAAAAGVTTFISGFKMTASGATAGLPVVATVAGVVGGTQSYIFTFPAGALVGATPLVVVFDPPLAASAVNTAITVTLPAGGAGNTNAACSAQGFRQ